MRQRTSGAVLTAAATLLAVFAAGPSAAAGEGGGDVEFEAVIDGSPLAEADSGSPLSLGTSDASEVEATIRNGTNETVTVSRVRLEGTAFGITFLAYDTQLPFSLEPDETVTVLFDVPVGDLSEQATGLLPASLGVYDVDGQRVAAQSFTLEVEGDGRSVMEIFAMVVAFITLVSILLNAYLIIRRRLPPNRIARGVRFLMPGVGLGLLFALLLGIARITAPHDTIWPFVLLLPSVGGFLLGYVSPGPLDMSDDYDEFDDIADPGLVSA